MTTKILFPNTRFFPETSDSGTVKGTSEVLQGLKGPSIRRDVEVNLPVLAMFFLNHLFYPVAACLGLCPPFLSERYLWIGYPCVHALIHVSFALSVPDKDYPSRPGRNSHAGSCNRRVAQKNLL